MGSISDGMDESPLNEVLVIDIGSFCSPPLPPLFHSYWHIDGPSFYVPH